MRRYLLPLLLCFASLTLYAQRRSSGGAEDYERTMARLRKECNQYMGNEAGGTEDFALAVATAKRALKLVRPDDLASQALFNLLAGVAYYNQVKFDTARYYLQLAYDQSRVTNVPDVLATTCSALVAIYLQQQQPGMVDSFKTILQSIADTTRSPKALCKAYYALGTYYNFKSYYTTAQDYIIRGLEISRHMLDTSADYVVRKEYALQHYLLYKLYFNTNLYNKALAALREGSPFSYTSPIVRQRFYAAFMDAYTSDSLKNIDSALHYYRLLQHPPRTAKGIPSEWVTSNISLAQYYMNAGNFKEALPYLHMADSLATLSKAPFLIHQVQSVQGRLAYYTGSFDKAISLLQQSAEVARNVNRENYIECLRFIIMSYKALGNKDKVIEYYQLYDVAKDSLNNENRVRSFADQETRYGMREKEREITSLSGENRLRTLALRNATRLRMLLIAGLIVLGIVSLLLYRIYRKKERLNKILNDQNQELDKLNARLALANESKAKLFGIFSHDLRSPVSKIAQFLRLQKDNPDLFSEHARSEYHEKFTNITANLLNTMEDLLLWSKSQMENFSPEYHATAIKELADKEISLLHGQIEEKELHVHNRIAASFMSITDENFISIIFRNLLQNAVRYSEQGTFILLEAKDNKVLITNKSISGQPAAALNELLKKQTVSSHQSGLGLQIARDLAAHIGIRLSFEESEPGYITALMEWRSDV